MHMYLIHNPEIYMNVYFSGMSLLSLLSKKAVHVRKKIFKKKNTLKPKRDSAESDLDAYVLMYL